MEVQESDPQYARDKADGTKQFPLELSTSHIVTYDSDEENNKMVPNLYFYLAGPA